MSNVILQEVGKTYQGNVSAVRNISFTVPDGELCVLVGPSGCGKSTLLRMIAGLETITDGTIQIDNKIVNDIEPADRDIAFVFQNYALYPHMTVYGNMSYGLKNRGMGKVEIEERVQKAAKILELSELLERKPRQLSGGQRQRVAMGRAIVREPKVFLFDEPLSNLDAKLRVSMRVELKKLQRDLKTTAVYVTHDQLEAMTLADILVVMNKGVIEQIGKPMEIYNQPQTLFAATFIGAPPMNIIDFNGVHRGFRAEHIVLGKGYGYNFTLTTDFAEPVGAETYLYGLNEHGDKITVRVNGLYETTMGEVLSCYVLDSNLHHFDKVTGKRTEL
jgi:sn-glycerol 3-phosphate transport system ATP-binding protein